MGYCTLTCAQRFGESRTLQMFTPLMLEVAVPGVYMYQPILYMGSCGSWAMLVALRSLGISPGLFQSPFLHPPSGQIVY